MARLRTFRGVRPQARTEIQPFWIPGWTDGWRADIERTAMPPASVYSLTNMEWRDGYTLRKRRGVVNIARLSQGTSETHEDMGVPDFVFAPRVYTVEDPQDPAPFPQYSQVVLHFNQLDGGIFYNSLGELWSNWVNASYGTAFIEANASMGPGSSTAVNRFRVWPLNAVTFGDNIYITSLRYGGWDGSTNRGDTDPTGNWQTQSGGASSPSLPLRYDAQADEFVHMSVATLPDPDAPDGPPTTQETVFVRARTMISKHERIFAANVHREGSYRYPSRIYWSGEDTEPANAQTWNGWNYIAVGADDGQEIVRILPFGEQILIFKNQSIYTLVGTSDTQFAVYQLDDRLGTEGTYASCAVAGAAYFLDERTGVWRYDGAQFENISDPIKDKLLAELNREAAYKAALTVHENVLYVSIPVGTGGSTANNTVTYTYDIRLGAWSRWTIGFVPDPFPMYTDFNLDGPTVAHVIDMFAGRNTAAGLWKFNETLQDNGSNYAVEVQLPWFNPGDKGDRHRVRRLDIMADEADGVITVSTRTNLSTGTADTFTYDPATGTWNSLQEFRNLDTMLWSFLSIDLSMTANSDFHLYGLGMNISSRPNPRGTYTKTGYQHS